MYSFVRLYSNEKGEISKFLNNLYMNKIDTNEEDLEWQKNYDNPIEMADIIGVFIENNDKFKINMWISLDDNILINVTNFNADEIIRYLYERFPY